jgi:prolyl-tRNA synthetase
MVVIGDRLSEQFAIAERLESELEERGVEVLFDDRDASPGVKFADAELIGAPVRVTVGKRTATDQTVDVQARDGREQTTEPVTAAAAAVERLLG